MTDPRPDPVTTPGEPMSVEQERDYWRQEARIEEQAADKFYSDWYETAAKLRDAERGLREKDEEIARLTGELAGDRAVCLCGCVEHENYGEDGESCENEDHVCIRVALGVRQTAEAAVATARRDAIEQAAKRSREFGFEFVGAYFGVDATKTDKPVRAESSFGAAYQIGYRLADWLRALASPGAPSQEGSE